MVTSSGDWDKVMEFKKNENLECYQNHYWKQINWQMLNSSIVAIEIALETI